MYASAASSPLNRPTGTRGTAYVIAERVTGQVVRVTHSESTAAPYARNAAYAVSQLVG